MVADFFMENQPKTHNKRVLLLVVVSRKSHLCTSLFKYFVEIITLRWVNVHGEIIDVLTFFVSRIASVTRKSFLT